MNYHLKSNKPKKIISSPPVIAIIVVVLLIVFSSIFSGFFVRLFSPIFGVSNNISQTFENISSYFLLKSSLEKENQDLREKASLNQAFLQIYNDTQKENEKLKNEWGRYKKNNEIIAGVLSLPPHTLYDILILDVGKDYNISKGMKVLSEEGIAIGEISEVYENTSKATLYSSFGKTFNAFLSRNNIEVSLKGEGGGNFEFNLPRDVYTEKGDTLYLPGIDGGQIATVYSALATKTDSFQRVLAKSPVNIFQLRFVKIAL